MLSEARAIDRAAQRHMKVEGALAPPYTLIHPVHREAEQIGVGAQDCHDADGGAHTGDISAAMLADAPVTIDGNARMRERPIGELVGLLRALGARAREAVRIDATASPAPLIRRVIAAGGAVDWTGWDTRLPI